MGRTAGPCIINTPIQRSDLAVTISMDKVARPHAPALLLSVPALSFSGIPMLIRPGASDSYVCYSPSNPRRHEKTYCLNGFVLALPQSAPVGTMPEDDYPASEACFFSLCWCTAA